MSPSGAIHSSLLRSQIHRLRRCRYPDLPKDPKYRMLVTSYRDSNCKHELRSIPRRRTFGRSDMWEPACILENPAVEVPHLLNWALRLLKGVDYSDLTRRKLDLTCELPKHPKEEA